jgi:hypothetical protein
VSYDEFREAWVRAIEAISFAHPQATPGRRFAVAKTMDYPCQALVVPGQRFAVTTTMDDAHRILSADDGQEV